MNAARCTIRPIRLPSTGAAWRRVCTLLTLTAALNLAGCNNASPSAERDTAAQPVEQVAERGPVRATVRAERGAVGVAEPLQVTLEVIAEADVEVALPPAAEQLGEFRVRSVDPLPDVPVASGRRWRQEYVLTSYSAGELEFPELTVRFTDRRNPDDVIESELNTPPLAITVNSLIAGEFDPSEYADIKGPVDLPADTSYAWLWWVASGLGGALVLAIVIWWLLRRPRVERVAPPVPAHEWALAELRRLEAEGLVERGNVHEFYFRLTAIVRQYIERRFGIMAAEQTTREFLAAAQAHPALGGTYRDLLADFLTAGDLVKFALHRPEQEETDRAFAAARDFVRETTPRPNEPREAAA